MTKSTITDLPKDIAEVVPDWEQNELIKQIVEEAKAGEFHDYKNNLYPCGKIVLAGMLQQTMNPAMLVIRQAVVKGDYDESPDAEDKALMKKDWLEGGGSLEIYETMFGKD